MIPTFRSFGRRTACTLTLLPLSGLCAVSLTPAQAQATLTTVAAFNEEDGAFATGGVTFDNSGNLFGTTCKGGIDDIGTVYEIAKGNTRLKTLILFSDANGSAVKGFAPNATVTFDRQGNLFGTTHSGGAKDVWDGHGTVFEVAKGSTQIKTLVAFNQANGDSPDAAVTFDGSGNLFGTTAGGGASDDGTVYEIAKGSTHLKTLVFFNGKDGKEPFNGVTFDRRDNLFGTTYRGGTNDKGTVFEFAKGSTHITTLASFDGKNGQNPVGGVTFDSSGNLFGTTAGGGANDAGTVYEIAKGSKRIKTIATFNHMNGSEAASSVTFDRSGNLFGTTEAGGAHNFGTVYEIAQGSTRLKTLASFNGTNGDEPSGAVTFDSSGNLFGTTAKGGAKGFGTVFEIAGAGSPPAALGSSPVGADSPSAAPRSSSATPKPPHRAASFLTARLLAASLLPVMSLSGFLLRARKRTRDTDAAAEKL